VTESDWNALREAISFELAPAVSYNSCVNKTLPTFLVAPMACWISAFLTGNALWALGFVAVLFILLILQMVGMAYRLCFLQPRIEAGLQTVLSEFSQQRPGATIHLQHDGILNYAGGRAARSHMVVDFGLEISFDDEACYILTSQQGDVEKATENGQSRATTDAAERLQNLENIRHLLSEKEYTDKRQGIIVS